MLFNMNISRTPIPKFISVSCCIRTFKFCVINKFERLLFWNYSFVHKRSLCKSFGIQRIFSLSSWNLLKVEHDTSHIRISIHRILDIKEFVVSWINSFRISIIRHLLLFLSSSRSSKVIIIVLYVVLHRDLFIELVKRNSGRYKSSVKVMSTFKFLR